MVPEKSSFSQSSTNISQPELEYRDYDAKILSIIRNANTMVLMAGVWNLGLTGEELLAHGGIAGHVLTQ
ncbi:Protein of unknown function, partial [Gryllus bimaculatus]